MAKISGELAGIVGGEPAAPYASSGGMTSTRRPPTFMPGTPWSQPWMTWPWPTVNSNGFLPRSHDASNCLPFLNSTPTYWTLTLSPALASLPLPTTTSVPCSSLGAAPVAFGIAGFLDRSVLTPDTLVACGSGSPAWRVFTLDFLAASAAGAVVDGAPSICEPSRPEA